MKDRERPFYRMKTGKIKFRKCPQPVVSHRRKVNWLLRHPEVWRGYPRPDAEFRREWTYGSKKPICHKEAVFIAMRKAGLFSASTNWVDVAIRNLIADANRILNNHKPK